MGKTFDALQKAERERQQLFLQPLPHIEKSVELYSPLGRTPEISPPWCQELWFKLKNRSLQEEIKTIMFTGISQGSGCTSTTAIFSVYLAVGAQKRVLVLDLNFKKPGLKHFFNPDDTCETAQVLVSSSIGKSDYFKNLRRNLAVVLNDSGPINEGSSWLESPFFGEFIEKAYKEFDLILFDTGQVTQSIETRHICSRTDAVVIVVKAGETRKKVALRVKEELEESGAKIAGVILSGRKYYIPKWLYSRL